MKLDIFNPWRDLTTWSGITIQYQSTKRDGGVHITYLRDRDSKKVITYGTSRTSRDESLARAKSILQRIGLDGVKQALETGKPVLNAPAERHVMDLRKDVSSTNGARTDVDWRDGANHRYRAQRDLVA